jgi:hypothetical protein
VRIGGPARDAPARPAEPPPPPGGDSLAEGVLGWIAALLAFLG